MMKKKFLLIFKKFSQLPTSLFLMWVLISSFASSSLVSFVHHQYVRPSQFHAPKNFKLAAVESANNQDSGQVLGSNDSFDFISNQGGTMNNGVIVLSSATQPVVRVSSYNFEKEVNFRLYKITQDDFLSYLLYEIKDDDSYYDGLRKLYEFDTNKLESVASFDQFISHNSNSRNESEINLDLDDEGLWYLEANFEGQKVGTVVVRSAIAGLANKTDNKITFWVQDAQQQLVSGAKITLLNTQDKITNLEELITDQQGLAHTLASKTVDLALVHSHSSFTIIPINLNGFAYRSAEDTYFYSSFSPRKSDLESFIFTDRFIYKPGDKVYFKAIIRNDDDADFSIPTGQVRVTLSGNKENKLYESSLLIDDWGTVDDELQLPEDMEVGYQSLSVYKGDKYLAGTSFQVAEFHKPDSIVSIDLDNHTYFPGDKLKAKVAGSYFLGQPLRDQEVKYKIYQNNSYISGDYQEVDFSSSLSDYGAGKDLITEGVVKLDRKGEADLEVSVENTTGFRKMWAVVLEYVDEGGSATNDGVRVLVNPGDFVIERDYSVESEQTLINQKVNLPIVLQPTKPNVKVANMSMLANIYFGNEKSLFAEGLITISDENGKTSLSFTPNQAGSYLIELKSLDEHDNPIKGEISIYASSQENDSSYRGSSESILVSTDKESYSPGETALINLETSFEPKDLFMYVGRSYSREHRVLTNGAKQFEIRIPEKYQPNVRLTVGGFVGDHWVSGSKNIEVKTDDKKIELSFSFDQESYGPGESAIVDIEAKDGLGNPVQADLGVWVFDKALLELNKENYHGIFNRFWNSRYSVPLLNHSFEGLSSSMAEGGGGCFDSETLITMGDGSYRKIAEVNKGDMVKTFKSVANNQLTNAKVVDTHQITVSGYLIINGYLKITPEHKLLVNDEWKLAGEIRVGDYLLTTTGKKEIVTSIEWIRGKFEVYNLQIDKFHSFLANDVYVHNDKGDTRTIFKDTAYWNPHVVTDSLGQAQLTIVLPDNLTTWVIAGVAGSKTTQVGVGEDEFIVTKELVVRPILPAFMRQGDQLILSTLVNNFTQNSLNLDVVADLDIASLSDAAHSLSLDGEDSIELGWETVIRDYQDSATFHVKAQTADEGGYIDEVYQQIPVYEYGFWQDSYVVGVDDQNYVLPLSLGADPDRTSTKLELSARKYPNFENDLHNILLNQEIYYSSLPARLTTASIAHLYREKLNFSYSSQQLKDVHQANLVKIAEIFGQDGDQLARYEDYQLKNNLSILESLIFSQQAGISVDQSVVDKFSHYYQSWSPTEWEDRVEKQYALSLFKDGNFAKEELFLQSHQDSQVVIKAILANYRNGFIDAQTGIDQVMELGFENDEQLAWPSFTTYGFSGVYNASLRANLALLELGAQQQVLEKGLDYLYRNRGQQASYLLLKAIATYFDQYTVADSQANYKVLVNDQSLASGSLASSPVVNKELAIKSNPGESLVINKTGQAPLYSKLITTEFIYDKELEKESHHLELDRKYLSAAKDDRPVQVGDLVVVELEVKNLGLGERDLEIIDYLPSGLIAIDGSLDNGEFDSVDSDYISRQKISGQGVELKISNASGRVATFRYKARVVSQGVFDTPPAVIKHAGQPELWARSDSTRLVIDGKNKLEMLQTDNSQALVNLDKDELPWGLIILGSVGGLIFIGYGLWINRASILNKFKKKTVFNEFPQEK